MMRASVDEAAAHLPRAGGVKAQEQPEVPTHVFLDLPQASTPGKGPAYHVGTITFFDALKLDHRDGGHAATATAATIPMAST